MIHKTLRADRYNDPVVKNASAIDRANHPMRTLVVGAAFLVLGRVAVGVFQKAFDKFEKRSAAFENQRLASELVQNSEMPGPHEPSC